MTQLNLRIEYDKLNHLIFHNQLPKDISLKWNYSKTCLGKTRIQHKGNGVYDFQISISRFYVCSDKEYVETLIHEMIHVFMVINGEFRKDKRVHGPLFKKYMNDINHQFPQYTIKVKENNKVEIDASRIALQNGFFLITGNNKKYSIYTEMKLLKE
jgi:hypothetical protein